MRPKPPARPAFDWPPDTAVAPSIRPTLLRCAACLRVEQSPPEAVRRLVPVGRPECCGRPMAPVVPPVTDPDPASAADSWADRRAGQRHPVRSGTQFEVRRGGLDLALALLEVSATGLKAAVRGGLAARERVVVVLAPPGRVWEYRGPAVVCWRADGAEGTGLVGLGLRTPLPDTSVTDLAEPDTR